MGLKAETSSTPKICDFRKFSQYGTIVCPHAHHPAIYAYLYVSYRYSEIKLYVLKQQYNIQVVLKQSYRVVFLLK